MNNFPDLIFLKSWTDYGGRESYRQNYGQDYRLYWLPSGWMVKAK